VSDAPAPLAALRDRLEQIDGQIVRLLADRMAVVEEVAAAKLVAASPLRDRDREELLLGRLRAAGAAAGLSPHDVERLYRVILDISVARQQAHVLSRGDAPLRVAYQGVEGAYSHLAAQRRYAGRTGGALLTGHGSFRAAADAVARGLADVALLPIENSTAGSINETYDLLADGGLTITGEVVARIEHCLLGVPGATLDGVRLVRSHPQALAQCQVYLAAMSGVVVEPAVDTAGAAEAVARVGDVSVAAIASEAAAATWGLVVLARGIQTRADNATRFVEVAPHAVERDPAGVAKTSLLLELADRPGALAEVLAELARRSLSLTKLESRPAPAGAWRYRFYLDVLGDAAAPPLAGALEALAPLTTELRVLGCYAAAPVG
jgi:chorismate mutase/prephenate dehydratase